MKHNIYLSLVFACTVIIFVPFLLKASTPPENQTFYSTNQQLSVSNLGATISVFSVIGEMRNNPEMLKSIIETNKFSLKDSFSDIVFMVTHGLGVKTLKELLDSLRTADYRTYKHFLLEFDEEKCKLYDEGELQVDDHDVNLREQYSIDDLLGKIFRYIN